MKKAKALDVWNKLRRAYKRKTGCRLTGDEVDQIILMDTAVHDVCFPEGCMTIAKSKQPLKFVSQSHSDQILN